MDLMKYKNQLNRLNQCIINVELAQTNYRTAVESLSYGMIGAHLRVKEAEDALKIAERTLESQARINCLINQEVAI